MKSWTKGLLVASAVCVGMGTVLCVSAWAMGGRLSPYQNRSIGIGVKGETEGIIAEVPEIQVGDMLEAEKKVKESVPADPAVEAPVGQAETAVSGSGTSKSGGRSERGFEISSVTKLEVKVSGGRAELIPDESTDKIQLVYDQELYQCYQETEHNTLEIHISGMPTSGQTLFDPNKEDGGDGPVVQILIPKESRFDEVELEVKGGSMTAQQLNASKLDMELDAGLLEVVLGSVGELSGDCKTGKLIYEGEATREVEADCKAGAIQYRLKGREVDFNYELEVTTGSVVIAGTKQGGTKKKSVVNHSGAAKKAELECVTGTIQVDFYE